MLAASVNIKCVKVPMSQEGSGTSLSIGSVMPRVTSQRMSFQRGKMLQQHGKTERGSQKRPRWRPASGRKAAHGKEIPEVWAGTDSHLPLAAFNYCFPDTILKEGDEREIRCQFVVYPATVSDWKDDDAEADIGAQLDDPVPIHCRVGAKSRSAVVLIKGLKQKFEPYIGYTMAWYQGVSTLTVEITVQP